MMKRPSPVALVFALFLLPGLAVVCRAQTGCPLLDKDRRAHFITYERYVDFAGFRFRLTNNTACTITVERDDDAAMRLVKRDGKTVSEFFFDSRDGAVIRLHYLMQDNRRRRAPERGYGWGDSVYTYDIPAGQTAFFHVSGKSLNAGLDIVVPFKYAWETNDTIGFGPGGVSHRLYFLNSELPADARRFLRLVR